MSENLPYLNPGLPLSVRVTDLVGRLTLAEKLSQMTFEAPAIPRLGVPAYNYWGEALHGVARNGRATVFPQVIGMAATWDGQLIKQVASAIGDEGRAKFHALQRRGSPPLTFQSLNFWSPNINIFRDPRWGRGQETWGEDPTLTGLLGGAFVEGLQGDDRRYLKAAACAKHYAVHSGPEGLRHGFDARVSPGELRSTYLAAFKHLVCQSKVEAVMGAYNRVNGEACCASPTLLEGYLRREWGFEGHVVSDCGAVGDIYLQHHAAQTPAQAAALALKAGCDLECGHTYDHLGEALALGLIGEADLDRALERSLGTRFKLGLFDPQEQVAYAAIPPEVIGCAAHRQLAYQAAAESVVLLKNRGGILPIRPDVGSISVVGPNAASVDALLGNYYGLSEHFSTLLEGLANAVPEGVRLTYQPGCMLEQPNANTLDYSLLESAGCDVTIACMGVSRLIEGEEGDAILSARNGDRAEIELPAAQAAYLKRLAAAGARVVLVLAGGSPIALGEIADLVEAIVYVWYPGQEGGRAVADVLFGRQNPSGKLPLTFPAATADLPPFAEYSMAGRTYRYAPPEPLYPFGFGLSYTRFGYADLQAVRKDGGLEVQVTVSNLGSRAGAEVVQAYLSFPEAVYPAPGCALAAFERAELAPGESRRLAFAIPAEAFEHWAADGERLPAPARFSLSVGSCSPGRRGLELGAPAPVRIEY